MSGGSLRTALIPWVLEWRFHVHGPLSAVDGSAGPAEQWLVHVFGLPFLQHTLEPVRGLSASGGSESGDPKVKSLLIRRVDMTTTVPEVEGCKREVQGCDVDHPDRKLAELHHP
mmetsp:Transcript_26442/g.49417  ORF Transcript_26442/g.49417 Transcript_26442/m.49417 type:complete len:114 (-) Transcript_26442:137-478(-)|eukprot:CAMPEP_0170189762 /NCGR_PEP_ID=MMETSP0040_2-20121228/47630_1 /TAXON_ID=641309 /ORGANISM="Lotharella oceanica, Strain CCMP622" /LENGTH=113 /DNA_ID=CAMNT_0010437417 /DNA_START=173 /DNA_END=514 /DNA_ORIENTATION=+